eukprot:TRINITY_DN94593_c0_g1_i1.p1 TRINITY_DN94593_c0_g1~~TRINITY_DN94593_c0_g1_i1.p1  ORF type:complete len:729 (+),score=117.19 TRINITY_DN94593_c0_g1_i1:324-2189(+)
MYVGTAEHTMPSAEWGAVVLATIAYASLVMVGVRFMERRAPIQGMIFEFMAVYNCVQVVLNMGQVAAILLEAQKVGFQFEAVVGSVAGKLIWVQYHCRQLELLDTFFMILRKKFEAVSFLHMYLRVLNMWGWFFACHYELGSVTLFPALVSSVAQAVQYLYFSMSLLGISQVPFFGKALITEVQLAQFIISMAYNLYLAVTGKLPLGLALLQTFFFINGVVLYTDFNFRETNEAPEDTDGKDLPSERVTFSFDSSGWMYAYQFGVAAFLQEHLLPKPGDAPDPNLYPAGLGFSGSSAGALTASLLASGTSVPDVFEHVLAQHKVCSRNPRKMPICVDEALRKFQFPGAYKIITGRLRILVTRMLNRPPFFMGEVVDKYPDNETAIQLILASCHIPGIFGILPYKVGNSYYYDGMMWSSLFVPWRGAHKDHIVKVSGIGSIMSDIRPPFIPLWWCILPPSVKVLRGLYWQGYLDALLWFRTQPKPLETIFSTCGRRDSPMPGSPMGAATRRSPKAADSKRKSSANSELQKWKAATALLKQKPPELAKAVAKTDSPSGEKVRTLLKEFYDVRSTQVHQGMLAASMALLVLGTFTPQIRSTVLAFAVFSAAKFAWAAGEDKRSR